MGVTRRDYATLTCFSRAKAAFAEDKQKDFVQQIIRLRRVPNDTVSDRTHHARIATEEKRQRLAVAPSEPFEKEFVGTNGH